MDPFNAAGESHCYMYIVLLAITPVSHSQCVSVLRAAAAYFETKQ